MISQEQIDEINDDLDDSLDLEGGFESVEDIVNSIAITLENYGVTMPSGVANDLIVDGEAIFHLLLDEPQTPPLYLTIYIDRVSPPEIDASDFYDAFANIMDDADLRYLDAAENGDLDEDEEQISSD